MRQHLAKAAITEAQAAAADVATMPAWPHEILVLTREAVERRACLLLARLQEPDETAVQKVTA